MSRALHIVNYGVCDKSSLWCMDDYALYVYGAAADVLSCEGQCHSFTATAVHRLPLYEAVPNAAWASQLAARPRWVCVCVRVAKLCDISPNWAAFEAAGWPHEQMGRGDYGGPLL